MGISKNDRAVFSLLLILLFFSLYTLEYHFDYNSFLQDFKIIPKIYAYYNNSWVDYTDNKLNISFIYPKNWELIKSPSISKPLDQNSSNNSFTWILKSPKENVNDSFQDNIVINLLKFKNSFLSKNDLDQKQIIEKLGEKNKNFIFNNLSKIMIGDNHTAESITYSFKNLGLSFKTKQIFSVSENNILIISLLGEQKTFNLYLPVFDNIIKNVSLRR